MAHAYIPDPPSQASHGHRGRRASPLLPAAVAIGLLSGVVITGSGCPTPTTSPPVPRTFTSSDLSGEWFTASVYSGQEVTDGIAPGWALGRVTIDADGYLSYSDYLDPLGGGPRTDLRWSIDQAGDLGAADGTYGAFYGRLASNLDTAVVLAREGTRFSLQVLRHTGAGASPGVGGSSWRYHALVTGGETGWEHGTATVDADGVLALTGRTTSAGPAADLVGAATLAVSAGEVVGTDDTGAAVLAGWVAPDRGLLVLSAVLDPVAHVYWTLIGLPAADGVSQGTLSGQHVVEAFDVGTSSQGGTPTAQSNWLHGPNDVDATGVVTFGEFTTSADTISDPTPVTVHVAAGGDASMVENATYHGSLSREGDLFVATANVPADSATSRLVLWIR